MIIKKQLLLFVMMLLPMVAMADAVEIDGIFYNLITKGRVKDAEVTSSPNGYQGNIVIPETVNYDNITYSVTCIGNSAFSECSGLTSVTIPNSVTSIGEIAFYHCSDLTSVTIPNSVKSIGGNAFYGCDISTVISLIENPFAIEGKTSIDKTFSPNTFDNATLNVPKGTISARENI